MYINSQHIVILFESFAIISNQIIIHFLSTIYYHPLIALLTVLVDDQTEFNEEFGLKTFYLKEFTKCNHTYNQFHNCI